MFLWGAATVLGFFVKGLCGFANTLIFTSILGFGDNNVNISPVDLLLGYPTNLILVWKERQSVRWRVCLPLTALVVCGMVPGVLFLKNGDSTLVKLLFGAVTVLIGLEMLLREFLSKPKKQSKLVLAVIGVASGLLCGLYGIGALLSAYVSRVTDSGSEFKANICVVFFVEGTLRIILYTIWGILTPEILRRAVLLVPFMLLGLALGMRSSRALDERTVKKCVAAMLVLSGGVLAANSLQALL